MTNTVKHFKIISNDIKNKSKSITLKEIKSKPTTGVITNLVDYELEKIAIDKIITSIFYLLQFFLIHNPQDLSLPP